MTRQLKCRAYAQRSTIQLQRKTTKSAGKWIDLEKITQSVVIQNQTDKTSHVLPRLKFLPPTPQMWVYNKEQLEKLGPRKGTMESGGLRIGEYKGREKWKNGGLH